jgi:hypothetical protein
MVPFSGTHSRLRQTWIVVSITPPISAVRSALHRRGLVPLAGVERARCYGDANLTDTSTDRAGATPKTPCRRQKQFLQPHSTSLFSMVLRALLTCATKLAICAKRSERSKNWDAILVPFCELVSSAMLDAIVTSVTPPKKGRQSADNQSSFTPWPSERICSQSWWP